MPDDTLQTFGLDLDEARARIEAAREALQAAPQDAPEIHKAVARPERIEAELDRIGPGVSVPSQDGIETALASFNTNNENIDSSRRAIPLPVIEDESAPRSADFGLIPPRK